MAKNVILIGNGETVLDRELGHVIDNTFDVIVRFNEFETIGYEKFIGKRVTHIIVSKYLVMNISDVYIQNYVDCMRDKYGNVEIMMCTNLTTYDDYVTLSKKSEDRCGISICPYNVDIKKQTIVKDDLLREFNVVSKLSTGLMSMLYFLQIYREIYITGFDSFKTNHYYDKKHKIIGHETKLEQNIINYLINNKMVINI